MHYCNNAIIIIAHLILIYYTHSIIVYDHNYCKREERQVLKHAAIYANVTAYSTCLIMYAVCLL